MNYTAKDYESVEREYDEYAKGCWEGRTREDDNLLRYIATKANEISDWKRRTKRLKWLLIGTSICRLVVMALNT